MDGTTIDTSDWTIFDGTIGDEALATWLMHVAPPSIACGTDAGSPGYGDPCLHYVECVGAGPYWALTYYSGTCVGGVCTFAIAPTPEPCQAGCFHGPSGRCTRPGPTAP